jgi:tetratricopeptide (TPR) repeat protein
MEIEARLPQMIEEAVTSRFQNMATRLQQEIEETHLRTLETFVKNIQVKLVQRVSVLETDMARQAEAMNQLREYSQRTEDNLSRLISGVDKLAQELPKRLAAPAEPVAPSFSAVPVAYEAKPVRRRASSGFNARTANTKIFWIAISVLAVIIVVGAFQLPKLLSHGTSSAPASGATAAAAVSGGAASPKVAPPPAGADTASRMKAAAQYADNKEYSLAENIYKEVLRAEPDNADARKALASVLYREDKIEESAAELEKLPRN